MAGIVVERVLERLTGVKTIAGGWAARCPAHDDKIQSLQISERDDLSVGLHCHAGCDKPSMLGAMGLEYADLFAPDGEKVIARTYDYKSMDGTLLYQSVRFFPKEFRQRRPDGGGWSWDMIPLKGKHVPYRLPDLKGHNVVVVVEGEKDAEKLWALDIAATTNIGGAGKWGASESKHLQNAGCSRVIILPDNDEAGKKHAVVVGQSVRALGMAVSVIELPDLPPHGDVSDWLLGGGSKEALVEILAGKPYVLPPAAAPSPVVVQPDGYVPLDSEAYHLTDLGAAESFRDRYGHLIRYDHQRERWLLWDGNFWKPDADEAASRLANEHVRFMQRDALAVPDFLTRKTRIDFAMGREKRASVVSMMQQAATLKPIAISGDDWDADGWLFGCANGVVDLKTGQVRPGQHDDFITLQSSSSFGHAECSRWLKFLDEIFDGNAELVDYIWRAVGYSLTADMREQCFFVMFGSGSNGKSIFIDTLEKVWGSYGHRADMRMFAGNGVESSFANADFRGKRLVFAAEVKPGARMNEHILKHLTGGESLRAEHKYGRSFTIHPVGKIWLGVNHRPKVSDDSYGFWRRVRMVPFLRTFKGADEDRTLKDVLVSELPGILAWAVQGCLEWQARGLEAPAIVQAATDDYKAGEDPLADFFGSRTYDGPEAAECVVTFPKLYAAYREWATSMGVSDREKMTAKAFGNAMSSRNYEKVTHNNVKCFKGFELLAAPSLGGFSGSPYDDE